MSSAPTAPADLTTRPQWQALAQHAAKNGGRHLRDLFAVDPKRGEQLSVEGVGLYLD
jgi:glucose-6-phosphate isomerase